jgi:Toprim domain
MTKVALSFATILAITGGAIGTFDAACPACGPDRRSAANRRRPVLRIWAEPNFASFNCARCGLQGHAREAGVKSDHQKHERLKLQATNHKAEHRQRDKAQWLWRQSKPAAGTIVQTYLASRGIELATIPATLRFLPPYKSEHHPAMIAPFGMPSEPEPGVLEIDEKAIAGVHLTLLKPDGAGKAEIEPNKIMVGPSMGSPIVLAPMNDLLGLAITEGIENGLTAHLAEGLGGWAAGSASRLPALAAAVPTYTDSISIFADNDNDGRRHALELARRLRKRGLFVERIIAL